MLPASILHPLVHQNMSDFTKQQFCSIFTGKEFFLDHVIRGKKNTSCRCYLEMVHAAVEKTLKEKRAVTLKQVVWVQPLFIESESVVVHLAFYPEEKGQITTFYEKYNGTQRTEKVFSQGRIETHSVPEVLRLNLETLQNQCGKRM